MKQKCPRCGSYNVRELKKILLKEGFVQRYQCNSCRYAWSVCIPENVSEDVFDKILDLEWRMARVTPFYLQQAGLIAEEENEIKGTIDFEAYLPYRGDRSKEWLEIQNVSIVGEKYIKAFNIKTQRSQLWSGCSGIGLERWMTAFLAQKGLEYDQWPSSFKKYLPRLPEMPKFL